MDSFRTIKGVSSAKLVISRSEFIANATGVAGEIEALAFLEDTRSAHPKARHTAFAYKLRQNTRTRHSDDGEPAKTAGLPILNVIEGFGVTDCIVTVTRYFGGVLLGTGGLVRTYGGAAKAALEKAELLTVRRCVTLQLTIVYPQFESVQRLLEGFGARMEEPVFSDVVAISATMPAEQQQPFLTALTEATRGSAKYTVGDVFFAPL